MAWSYSAYESEATDAARLSMLRDHMAEVQAEIGPALKVADRSRDNEDLVAYLGILQTRSSTLERKVAASTGGMFTKWRPV